MVSFLNSGSLLREINCTIIALAPKVPDAGASINTPNIGNSALIIEELDWGGQEALNTCENSFFWTSFGPWKTKKRDQIWTNP